MTTQPHLRIACRLTAVAAEQLSDRLGFEERFETPDTSRHRALHEWRMEENDEPILRYLFRNARPGRHLEFGTWEGRGTLACLEECECATVWTINLWEGEETAEGRWAYDAWLPVEQSPTGLTTRTALNGRTVVRTDARGSIGRLYLQAGYGHRVNQIFCDSRQWDDANYPDGFFDTVLIDGGHSAEIVASDSLKALRLARPDGGLILWHDYCPDESAQQSCASIGGVMEAIEQLAPVIANHCLDWFWIEPSWLLVGVRNDRAFVVNPPRQGRRQKT